MSLAHIESRPSKISEVQLGESDISIEQFIAVARHGAQIKFSPVYRERVCSVASCSQWCLRCSCARPDRADARTREAVHPGQRLGMPIQGVGRRRPLALALAMMSSKAWSWNWPPSTAKVTVMSFPKISSGRKVASAAAPVQPSHSARGALYLSGATCSAGPH